MPVMTIAVTAATGHVGSRVTRLLVQAGVRPLVLVRDPSKLDSELRGLVDVAQGDLTDAGFVSSATKGAEALLWIVPEDFTAADPLAGMTLIGEHGAAAVSANGIGRVVLISSVGAERRRGAGLIDGLARNEELLTGTGADVLVLRCGYFFTNLLNDLDSLRAGTLTTTMTPDVPLPWTDPRDIGDVAAARLLSPHWSGPVVQAVHGPEDLSWSDVARVVGEAIGRDVSLTVLGDDDLRSALGGAGLPPALIEGIVGMTAGIRDGFTPEQPRSYVTTTPTTLRAWAWANLRPLV